MNFDSDYFGEQGMTEEDLRYRGSVFAEVRKVIFANSYYLTWRGPGEPPLPVYDVSLGRALRWALPRGKRWGFQQAANRSVDSLADLRWGRDRLGFRRILHPNAVCLTGTWKIDDAQTGYTGYFSAGREASIVARYSTCCSETRRGRNRSPSLVGKLFPITNPDDRRRVRTANFITQEDLGGTRVEINDAELRNAPDITPWRRGAGLPVFLLTAFVLMRADKEPKVRQLHEIAELGEPEDVKTRAPEFMRLVIERGSSKVHGDDLDFRDELLGRIYDPGHRERRRTLSFHIDVSDSGKAKGILRRRFEITNWKRIGRITFDDAVASYNGDFVLHFHHPVWRHDRNNPRTRARPARRYAATGEQK